MQGIDPDRLRLLICALNDAAGALEKFTLRTRSLLADVAAWCRTEAQAMRQRLQILDAETAARSEIERDAMATTSLAEMLRSAGLATAGLDQRVARDRVWLNEDRHFLLFDPAGDGRVAEVHGDLVTAVNIAVVVPGVGTTVGNFDHVSSAAVDLARAADAAPDGSTAVIAWLGYDPPDVIPLALTARPAVAGAFALSAFVTADVPRDAHLTLIGHSYGSLVVGLAARDGAPPGDVVLLGSPGVSARTVADLGLPDTTTVWAARAPGDPIALAIDPLAALGFGFPGAWAAHRQGRLVFGQDPASAAFGAVRLATGPGVRGHGDYFKPGSLSLENLARIVDGRRGDVVLEIG